jgi:hypothetical protein
MLPSLSLNHAELWSSPIGNPIDGLQVGSVVLLENNTRLFQRGDCAPHIRDRKAHLRVSPARGSESGRPRIVSRY